MHPHPYAVFQGLTLIGEGDLTEMSALVRLAMDRGDHGLLMFDLSDGSVVDLPVTAIPAGEIPPPIRRSAGRPRLGVSAREVTLLPRHWDWLATRPGGASATLRRIVEAAMKDPAEAARLARETTYRFMTALAGNLEGYEEACRALFAGNRSDFEQAVDSWPEGVSKLAQSMAEPGLH